MIINFKDDLQKILKDQLIRDGYKINLVNLSDLAYVYLNIEYRKPKIQKWKVQKSIKLKGLNLSNNIRKGLSHFEKRAVNGLSLYPHISKQIRNSQYKDMMLYDWGIFHFHLGETYDLRGFSTRTNELLFAYLKNDTIYMIDVLPHSGSFYEQDLLNEIEVSWPFLLNPFTMNGVLGIKPVPTNNAIKKMRLAGIQTSIQTNSGRVLAPMGGGYTTAGTSLKIQMEVSRMVSHISNLERYITGNSDNILLKITTNNYIHKDLLFFKLLEYGQRIIINEVITNTKFQLF